MDDLKRTKFTIKVIYDGKVIEVLPIWADSEHSALRKAHMIATGKLETQTQTQQDELRAIIERAEKCINDIEERIPTAEPDLAYALSLKLPLVKQIKHIAEVHLRG